MAYHTAAENTERAFEKHELPESGKVLLKRLTEEREEKARNDAMCKAAAEKAERKRLRMAPDSTQKRSFGST